MKKKMSVKAAQERSIKEHPVILALHNLGFSDEVIREAVSDMTDEELIAAAKLSGRDLMKAAMKL